MLNTKHESRIWTTKREGASAKTSAAQNGATLGFDAKPRVATDAVRNNMDSAEYKHVDLVVNAFLDCHSVSQKADPRAARTDWIAD